MTDRNYPGMGGVVPLLLLLILASNVWIGVTVQQGLSGGGSDSPSPSVVAPPAAAPSTAAPAAAPAANPDTAAANVKKPNKDDYVKGAKNPVVSVIMYSDYQCPFCQRVKPTIDQLLAAYPTQINVVHRDYPLAFHPNAKPAAIAALCVGKVSGQDAFWKFADAAYTKSGTDPNVLLPAGLKTLAQESGANMAKWQTCFDNKETEARVDKDVQEGSTAGVNGTPGFILINNKTGKTKSVAGAQPIASFEAALTELGVTK